ncbi:MAG: hypothetical protein OI860_00195 (plasmid) [Candidatus Methanoperedens sp.]|uniref:hypothetical protein n=1 Tax=Candidatus Methanoperedens sp. BLZ2 TaxID=2035255 RepID=UPI000BE42E1D|nr:hypothetical protein [Candidatus Methanoperedens sp. BLZ2]KAB2946431.1 MAG: hypothetical protein F9K14_07550 [Candidatus Methanoperedens sp.]MBZ0175667.1 hypothetical protein [Candidatus Methanoperedens nitroreducens]WAH95062.1 MAG: hypothetical protein OI863_00270 [Candidatus Methanoperedens sp.]WAM22216.1 MAG: hypothetical protein OI860_00195 [Candidatus Methanoperedens sp.]
MLAEIEVEHSLRKESFISVKKRNVNYKNILYSFIVIFLFTSVAGAESGKVVVNDTQEKTYTHVYTFGNGNNWATEYNVLFDKLYFDTSSWDHLAALTINLTNLYSFPPRDYTTSFTISSGGSGGGVVSFSRLNNKVHWAFNDNAVITSSDIVLSYDTNIFTNLKRLNYLVQYYKVCSPDTNEPAFVRVEEGGCYIGSDDDYGGSFDATYDASVSVSSTIPYVVTYSSNSAKTYFNFTYTKPDVLYHVIIQDSLKAPYYDEMGFTSGTSASVVREYGKGIYFNVTSLKGKNQVITINATEESHQTPSIDGSSIGGPYITSFNPSTSIVKNNVGEKRTFSVTTNQTANLVWSLNSALVQTNSGVTQGNYINASASPGTWIVTSIVSNANGGAIQYWVWVVEPIPTSTLNILAYYRGLGDDPDRVESSDILKATNDWMNKTVPAGFTESITYQELLTLIYQWF